jgi:allene oxide cyclase-like protein
MKWTLVVAVALAAAAAAAFAAKGGTAKTTTMKIVATQHDFGQVDTGKRGPSAGDLVVFSEALRMNGKAAGADHITCTLMGMWPKETDFCRGLFVLPGGTLIAEGASTHGPFTVAVTGGTGRYAGAHGTMHSTPTKTGEILEITLV